MTLMLLSAVAAAAFAEVPRTMTFQGKLTDNQGNTLTGSYDFIFKAYDAALSGNVLWTEVQSGVTVSGGIYNVLLGANAPMSLAFDADYWLEIQVKPSLGTTSYEIMLPRTKLITSPYAMRSEYSNFATSASSATYIANNANWNTLTGGGVTTLHSHATGQQGSVGGYQIIDATITAADIADYSLTPVKFSTAAAYNLSGSTITAARYYGDGSQLTNIGGATDSLVRISTGVIQSQTTQIALSTGTIKTQLDQVAYSTGTLLRLNGATAMNGKLDLGGNDTTNVFVLTVSTVNAYYVKASTIGVSGMTKFYGDGSSLSGMSAVDSAVRLSTGTIKALLDQVVVSTGTLLRLNGTLPMSGKLDLGGNDTTNVFVLTVSTVNASLVKTNTLRTINGDVIISTTNGSSHGIYFPDGTFQFSAYPQTISAFETASDTLTNSDTTLISASITPLSTANRVKITVSVEYQQTSGNGVAPFTFKVRRNTTDLVTFHGDTYYDNEYKTDTFVYVDTPSSTSQITYALRGSIGNPDTGNALTKSITLEEIGPN